MTKTAYKKALRSGSMIDVAAALDAGMDVDVEIDQGRTALHEAVKRGQAEIVNLLLNRNANANRCDSAQNTPLDIALETGRSDIVDNLRSRGGKTFDELVKERVQLIRVQTWASGFGW
jgi:ankyrin repeat protein